MISINPQIDLSQKNIPKKLCANCKNAIIQKSALTSEKPRLKCAMYYKLELEYGQKYYENAFDVRSDANKCGINGKYYEGRTKQDNLV